MTLITYLTRVHFADGVFEEALFAEYEAGKKSRPLVICDADRIVSDAGERLLASFPVRTRPVVFTDISHDPREAAAQLAARSYLEHGCNVLVAFGSSQTIDLAKLTRLAIAHQNGLVHYTHKQGGSRLISPNLPDLIAIPNINGFGAAVSAYAPVMLESGERTFVLCKKLIPSVTICDPTLTLEAGAEESASAGANAITYCIEAYLSKSYNPPAEGIALDGLQRAVGNLYKVIGNGGNIDARREMMAASLNGALALQKGLGASRAISHALSAVSDNKLNHGVLNRITLPRVLEFNEDSAPQKYESLRNVFKLPGDLSVSKGVDRFFQDLPLPRKLGDLGLTHDHLARAAQMASEDIASETNPRQVIAKNYLSIMQSVL